MLLPALSKAREKARQAVCMNNMKQIGLAALMYINNHDDYLPSVINQWGGATGAGFLVPLYPYFGYERGNLPDDSAKSWSGYNPGTTYHLGKFKGWGRGISYQFTMVDYGYYGEEGGWSRWVGSGDPDKERGRYVPHKTTKVPPDSVIVIEQQMVNGYPGGQFPLPQYANLQYIDHGPNWLHSDGSNFLFFDGSVHWFKRGQYFNYLYVPEY